MHYQILENFTCKINEMNSRVRRMEVKFQLPSNRNANSKIVV